jgi:hypothetical protein
MKLSWKALSASLLAAVLSVPAMAQSKIQHVLLISVDGLHALDFERFIAANPSSAMAQLASHGITYSNARTPANSDSFPGLLALVTGGSPNTSGLFYDVSYDRTIFDPTNITCSGPAGNTMVFDESIDLYNSNNVSQNVIDPTKLPRYRDQFGNCAPLYPHNALRTNTIFEVAKSRGLHTAWADKHPAYDLVNGPSGKGVDDLYTPEITNVGGLDNTHSEFCTTLNDGLKVAGIINEINGLTHDGKPAGGPPAIFGMNFQAVSVGQKLIADNFDGSCPNDPLNGQAGGYLDGSGTPSPLLTYALNYVDGALGQMITALKGAGIYDSTLFIVSAKHGQSPINPAKINKPGHFAKLVAALPDSGTNPAAIAIANANNCSTGPCGFVQDDDIALIWLQGQPVTGQQVTDYLNANVVPLFAEQVLGTYELALQFNDPASDSRTPDIMVQPLYGTIYTGSTSKNAEHGGFSFGDRNVGLIVSNPSYKATVIKSPVTTAQVAATIVKSLGIPTTALNSVKIEKTQPLPLP